MRGNFRTKADSITGNRAGLNRERRIGKMTLEEIAEATELSLDIVKELENQSMQLA